MTFWAYRQDPGCLIGAEQILTEEVEVLAMDQSMVTGVDKIGVEVLMVNSRLLIVLIRAIKLMIIATVVVILKVVAMVARGTHQTS